jgi:hypothetical protein
MRALILLVNIGVLAGAWYFASFVGLMIGAGVCVILAAGIFAFSMARTEARESKDIKRAMGRNTTLLGRLL